MDEKRLTSLKELESRLGHRFNEIEWLDKALIHGSYSNEINFPEKGSNEVLEFLGDAVLNLAVSRLLFEAFPDAQEGTLSQKRAHLVKQSSLAFLSRQLRLEEYLLLGKGEILNGGMEKPSILANAYEALIGAIFMDSGFNRALETLRLHLESYLPIQTEFPLFDNHKSVLQEYSQRAHGVSPQYRVLKESGPDHDTRFQASVIIQGEVKGIGWGRSKKEAEQEAAKNALQGLRIADGRWRIEKSET